MVLLGPLAACPPRESIWSLLKGCETTTSELVHYSGTIEWQPVAYRNRESLPAQHIGFERSAVRREQGFELSEAGYVGTRAADVVDAPATWDRVPMSRSPSRLPASTAVHADGRVSPQMLPHNR